MTSETEEVVIRRARAEDLDALLEIGDVYSGRDYFQDGYMTYLDDPDMYPLVAVANGKAVGFYMNHVIDAGQTIIKRAGRVHQAYRGQGIFHKLSDMLDKQRQVTWATVKYEDFAANNKVDRAMPEFREKGFVEIIRKPILSMMYSVKTLQGLDDPTEFDQVVELSYDEVKMLFSHDDVTDRFFPQRRIFNFFIGYRLLESNLRYLVNDNHRVYATTLSSSSSSSSRSRNIDSHMIHDFDILSFSHVHQCARGQMYGLDLYTNGCNDNASLIAHVKKHLRVLNGLRSGQGPLLVTCHSEVEKGKILSILAECGIDEVIPGTESHKVLYERTV